MTDQPCECLCALIQDYGQEIINESSFQSLLLDYFQGGFQKERYIILVSISEGIPDALIERNETISYDILASQQIQKLIQLGFTGDLAEWVINSWATALDCNGYKQNTGSNTMNNKKMQQEIVVTQDGTEVLLKPDGTWEYISRGVSIDEFHFRKTNWGMSKRQVKTTESLQIEEESDDVLVYGGQLLGRNAFIVFLFVNGKLARGRYVISQEHSNLTDFITDYDALRNSLMKKYGEPEQSQTVWKNELYKDDPSEWGDAISYGHLVYYSTWENSETIVSLILCGENYEIQLTIEYESKELKPLLERHLEQQALDEL